jgi:hypothetical protein
MELLTVKNLEICVDSDILMFDHQEIWVYVVFITRTLRTSPYGRAFNIQYKCIAIHMISKYALIL